MSSAAFSSKRPECSNDDCEARVRSSVGRLGDDDPLCSSCIQDALEGGA